MRILLVEDDTLLRAQLRTALQGAGYSVDEAGNGRDAQFLGETEAVDAVVLDLGLPVVDGLTVLTKNSRAVPRPTSVSSIVSARPPAVQTSAALRRFATSTPAMSRRSTMNGSQVPTATASA